MSYLCMLRNLKVLQNGTTSYHTIMQMIHTESLQVLYREMMQEFLACRLLCEHPIIEFKGEYLIPEKLFEFLLLCTVKENFLGLEIAQQFFHVIIGALTGEKLTRRDIQKGNSTGSFSEVDSREEVILLVIQHIITHGHTRCYELCDTAFHQFLSQFRVFQLVTDSHSPTRPNQLWQIGVEGMMRKTGHFVTFSAIAVISSRQRNAKNSRGIHGIIAIRLVEITTTKQ